METLGLEAILVTTTIISAVAALLLSRFASVLGIVDIPGGRKAHLQPIPLVGGLAIFVALLAMAWVLGLAPRIGWFLFALSLVVAIGFWDDVSEVRPRLKFAIQLVASGVMIWGASIEINTIGDLIGWRSIGLSIFAVPLTMFAIVGVVNSINMLDGLDGLAGSVSIVAFVWYALAAAQTGLEVQALTAFVICGAVAGFLLFNLRFPWQRQARVFLGDAGSLMLGFALGWYAIDLTQGTERSFPPIAALWVLMLPLCDCVSLMIRRVRARKSPFVADRCHIHHYLLARGFTASQTLAILVGVSVICGAIGYFAWLLKLQEAALFYPFFFGFFAYHAWIQREWEKIERREAGAPSQLPQDEKDSPAPAA